MASALKAVGSNQTITTGTSPASTTAISQQTDTLRIVAETAGVHVAVGANPTATTSDIYVGTSGGDEKNQSWSRSISKSSWYYHWYNNNS